jgi:dolichol-phosphate mannosyltransferase
MMNLAFFRHTTSIEFAIGADVSGRISMSQRIAIIVPTLNEADNIVTLIPKIFVHLPLATVVVVDHRSVDKTADAAQALQNRYANLVVIRRLEGRGLADAYRAGFEYASTERFDYVMQMDADGSHDPAQLVEFQQIAADFDLIVGSRYLPMYGRMRCSWPRRMLSKFAHWYARMWLKLPLTDVTSGFRLLSARFVERWLSVDRMSGGYCVQIETAWLASRNGFRITELPIEFHARRSGRSKLSARVLLEALWVVPALRWRN